MKGSVFRMMLKELFCLFVCEFLQINHPKKSNLQVGRFDHGPSIQAVQIIMLSMVVMIS